MNVEGVEIPDEQPAEEPPQPQQPEQQGQAEPTPFVECAFVVFTDENGHWSVTPDIHGTSNWQLARRATVDDFFHAACTVQKDIEVQQAGAAASQAMAITMQAMAQQVAQRRLEDAAGVGGSAGAVDLSNLRR